MITLHNAFVLCAIVFVGKLSWQITTDSTNKASLGSFIGTRIGGALTLAWGIAFFTVFAKLRGHVTESTYWDVVDALFLGGASLISWLTYARNRQRIAETKAVKSTDAPTKPPPQGI